MGRSLLLYWICLFSISAKAAVPTYVVLSVDWEGATLEASNLEAMQDFRAEFPQIPLTQFLNAAYFTAPGANPHTIQQRINGVLREGDQLGLHIHGWRHLVEAAGVSFRSFPSFWRAAGSTWREGGLGHDVPLSVYTPAELRKMIRFSRETLSANGWPRSASGPLKIFRAGGWMGSANVLEAIAQEGFVADSSAVPPNLLKSTIERTPLLRWLQDLWKEISPYATPVGLRTTGNRVITEYPNNASLADYVTGERAAQIFLDQQRRNVRYFHFGFHQETAARYISEVRTFVLAVRAIAERDGLSVRFVTPSVYDQECASALLPRD